jgi:hypothetical protein
VKLLKRKLKTLLKVDLLLTLVCVDLFQLH